MSVLAYCPRCRGVVAVEPVVQRVELVGGSSIVRDELMVSFESVTVEHQCTVSEDAPSPNPMQDRGAPCGTCGETFPHTHNESGFALVKLDDPTRTDLR